MTYGQLVKEGIGGRRSNSYVTFWIPSEIYMFKRWKAFEGGWEPLWQSLSLWYSRLLFCVVLSFQPCRGNRSRSDLWWWVGRTHTTVGMGCSWCLCIGSARRKKESACTMPSFFLFLLTEVVKIYSEVYCRGMCFDSILREWEKGSPRRRFPAGLPE